MRFVHFDMLLVTFSDCYLSSKSARYNFQMSEWPLNMICLTVWTGGSFQTACVEGFQQCTWKVWQNVPTFPLAHAGSPVGLSIRGGCDSALVSLGHNTWKTEHNTGWLLITNICLCSHEHWQRLSRPCGVRDVLCFKPLTLCNSSNEKQSWEQMLRKIQSICKKPSCGEEV